MTDEAVTSGLRRATLVLCVLLLLAGSRAAAEGFTLSGASYNASSQACSGSAMTLNLVANDTSGVAPHYVALDATGTTNSGGWNSFGDLLYEWDFGDTGTSGQGNWTNYGVPGNYAKDYGRGPVFGHVYEEAGSYTITLTVTDPNGACQTATQAITVTDPDTVFSGTNTVCLSTSGTFTGCPSGATQTTGSDFDATYNGGATRRLLLRAGETFTQSTGVSQTGGPNLVGRYDTGADPVLNPTGGGEGFRIGSSLDPLRIVNVDVDVDVANWRMITNAGATLTTGVTIVGVDKLAGSSQASDAIIVDQASSGLAEIHAWYAWVGGSWTGCLLDCFYLQARGTFIAGAEVAFGNTVHLLRFPTGRQTTVAYNYLHDQGDAGCSGGRNVLKVHSTIGTPPSMYDTSDFNLFANRIDGQAACPSWEVAFGPQADTFNEEVHEVIVDSNIGTTYVEWVFWTTDNTYVRNNLIYALDDNTDSSVIHWRRRGTMPTGAMTGFHAWNNTVVEPTAGGASSEIGFAQSEGTSECINNLLVGEATTLSACSGVDTNTTNQTADLSSACPFETCPPVASDWTDWKLANGSAPEDAGTCITTAALMDIEGNKRPIGGACDISADEDE